MMLRTSLMWLVTAAALGAGCAVVPPESSPGSPEAEVAAAERAFAQTMADRDFAAFQSFLAADAVFFDGPAPLRGKAAVAAAWQRFYDGPQAPFSWSPDQVVVLESGALALSTGPVHDAAGSLVGRFNSIWRREPSGDWRVVFDKGSPVGGPPAD